MKNIYDDAELKNEEEVEIAQTEPQTSEQAPQQVYGYQQMPYPQMPYPPQAYGYPQMPYPQQMYGAYPQAPMNEQQAPIDAQQQAQQVPQQYPQGQQVPQQYPQGQMYPYPQMPYQQMPYPPQAYGYQPMPYPPQAYGYQPMPYPPQQVPPQAESGIAQNQLDELSKQYSPAPQEQKDEDFSNGHNPKTRIIFQSEDFENIEEKGAKVESKGEFVVGDEPLGFGKDEEMASTDAEVAPEVQEEPKPVTFEFVQEEKDTVIHSGPLGTGFSVFDMEIPQESLNEISRKHPVQVKAVPLPQAPVIEKAFTNTTLPDSIVVEEYEEVFNQDTRFDMDEYQKNLSDDGFEQDENSNDTSFATDEVKTEESENISEVSNKKENKKAKEKKKKPAKKKKKVSKAEIVRRGVLTVAIIGIIASSGMLVREYMLSNENKTLAKEVEDLIIDDDEILYEDETTQPNDDGDKDSETVQLTPEQQWANIKEDYPDVIFPSDLQLKYAKLYAENQDFVGYLKADGVGLSLPVVQTENDDDYYRTNFYGKSTKYGCPFVTHLNNIDPLDQNTVIFGHHMNDGTVFGALDEYKTIEGFKEAPVIEFNTTTTDYQWKVVAAFITNAYEKEDNGYIFRYYFTTLSTEERFSAYLSALAERSLYDTGVDVLPTDKLLTLSTCSHEFNEARMVVVARMVRPGESTDVDTSLASVNSNPRYPQAYYDKKGQTNPFKDAYKWEVG